MATGISKKWSKLAKSWLGDKDGRHCHWCKHCEFDDGEAYCGNPDSKFCDGNRIRTWDGAGCAEECGVFCLDDNYKTDETYDRMMRPENMEEK